MLTRQLAQELGDRLDDDPQAGQRPHRRAQRRRIDPLLARVHPESLDQSIGQAAEQHFVQTVLDHDSSIVAHGALADVSIARIANIQRVMPSDVERQGLDRAGIGQIMKLLEDKPYIRILDIFEDERTRRAVVICFVALLELIKLQRVFARQEAPFSEILIYEKKEPVEKVWPQEPTEEIQAPGSDEGSSRVGVVESAEDPDNSVESWESVEGESKG